MVEVADVKALFPEITAADDAVIAQWLAVAEGRHNAEAFGAKSDFAVKALTAHLVTLQLQRQAGATGASSALSSRSVDGVSASFAVPQTSSFGDAALASTNAGQLYLDTREGIFAGRVV